MEDELLSALAALMADAQVFVWECRGLPVPEESRIALIDAINRAEMAYDAAIKEREDG